MLQFPGKWEGKREDRRGREGRGKERRGGEANEMKNSTGALVLLSYAEYWSTTRLQIISKVSSSIKIIFFCYSLFTLSGDVVYYELKEVYSFKFTH